MALIDAMEGWKPSVGWKTTAGKWRKLKWCAWIQHTSHHQPKQCCCWQIGGWVGKSKLKRCSCSMTFYNLISLVAILPSDFPSRTTLSYLFWAQVCWFLRRGQRSRNRFPTWKCQRQRPQKNCTNSSVQVRVQHVSERLSHFSWCLGVISQRPVGTTKWCPKAHDM